MTYINNSFVRALILLGFCIGVFYLAKSCGASDVRSALLSTGTMLSGVAAGHLQPKKSGDDDAAPTRPTN